MKNICAILFFFFIRASVFCQQTERKTLKYLYSISGRKTISGIHNREPNAHPAEWTNRIYALTGKYPGMWSGDFLFQQENIRNRQTMISEAISEWNRGSLINIMWHACNPALQQPCGFDSAGVLSHLSDQQWKDLLSEGTALNKKWKEMMDEVCGYLQQLKNLHIEILWRPLHEMNQGKFWWGGRPGPDGTRKLFQQMHDYMTKTKGLTNLVWVWDVQDFNTLGSDMLTYNPGKEYWDLTALDVYDPSGYTPDKYSIMRRAAEGKPFAIGECAKLPTAGELQQQPGWVFFMSWSELTFSNNNPGALTTLYSSPNVITLNDMPGWITAISY